MQLRVGAERTCSSFQLIRVHISHRRRLATVWSLCNGTIGTLGTVTRLISFYMRTCQSSDWQCTLQRQTNRSPQFIREKLALRVDSIRELLVPLDVGSFRINGFSSYIYVSYNWFFKSPKPKHFFLFQSKTRGKLPSERTCNVDIEGWFLCVCMSLLIWGSFHL